MSLSTPILWRILHSSGLSIDAATNTWRAKYSLGLRGRPAIRCLNMGRWYELSQPASVGTTQAEPCSAITTVRFGWRSNTPDHIRKVSGRWANHGPSATYNIGENGKFP